jgi:hypothetical protein
MAYNPAKVAYTKLCKTIVQLNQTMPETGVNIYCEEMKTLYQYEVSGSPADNQKIILSMLGGNNKWVGIAGQYSFYGGSSNPQWIGTYAQLKLLVDSATLIPYSYYQLTDYQTTHRVLGCVLDTINVDVKTVPTERLLLQADTTNTFFPTAYSLDHDSEEGLYDFFNSYVTKESSFDWVAPGTNSGFVRFTANSARSFTLDQWVPIDAYFYIYLESSGSGYELYANQLGVDFTCSHVGATTVIDITGASFSALNLLDGSARSQGQVSYGFRARKGYLTCRKNIIQDFSDICDYRGVVVARWGIDPGSVAVYSPSTAYPKGSLVIYGGILYRCAFDQAFNKQPSTSNYWVYISSLSDASLWSYNETTTVTMAGITIVGGVLSAPFYGFRFCTTVGDFDATSFASFKGSKINYDTSAHNDNIDGLMFRQVNIFGRSEISGYTTLFMSSIENSSIISVQNSVITGVTDSKLSNVSQSVLHSVFQCEFDSYISSSLYTASGSKIYNQCQNNHIQQLLYSTIGSNFLSNYITSRFYQTTIGKDCSSNVFYSVVATTFGSAINGNFCYGEIENCEIAGNFGYNHIGFSSPLNESTITASTINTITDSSKSWTPNSLIGQTVVCDHFGSAFARGDVRRIISNTSDTITVNSNFLQIPHVSMRYITLTGNLASNVFYKNKIASNFYYNVLQQSFYNNNTFASFGSSTDTSNILYAVSNSNFFGTTMGVSTSFNVQNVNFMGAIDVMEIRRSVYKCIFGQIGSLSLPYIAVTLQNVDLSAYTQTTTQRNQLPLLAGLKIWDSTLGAFYNCNGATWTIEGGATPGLMPSYTTIQRLALSPAIGQIVFDTDFDYLFCYNGTSWEAV